MNIEKWSHFQRTVSKLVKSGDPQLNPADLKELKRFCKKGDVVMSDVFALLIKHLHTKHCQVRLSAFQIIDELFRRSHDIRELTLEKLKTIVSLTLALELADKLPPPRKYHTLLKKYAIKAIDDWNEKFGSHYNKLRVSYKFLHSRKNVDFKRLIARTEFEQVQEEKRLQEEKNVAEYNVIKTTAAFEEQSNSFKDCVFEATACFNMLSPEGSLFLNENMNRDTDCTDTKSTDDTLKCREIEQTFTLSITVNHSKKLQIQETADNSSIIQTLDDRIHQAKRSFIPKLDTWIEELIKNSAKQNDVLPIIKSKEKLACIINKYDELVIIRTSKRKRRIVQKEEDDNNDSDFDEVDEDEVLNQLPEEKRLKLAMETSKRDHADTKHVVASFVEDGETPGSSFNSTDIKSIPYNDNQMVKVLKDQATIDEEDLALHKMSLVRFESLHRFWGTKDIDAEDLDINIVRALNPSYCNVPGKFEPVTWTCRAPLKSGKLCPRMDRNKCPLHGKVIARDKNGVPKHETLFQSSDMLSVSQSPVNGETWKEVEAEIERQTGEKLNYSKIKKKKEAKPTNLVNISKAVINTPRSRIEKKIFSRNAIKGSNASADKQDSNRNNSAFDQQFNYV